MNATRTSVTAAIHSKLAIASPVHCAAFPDIPMNCSVEILAAISEKPINHHPKPRPARKIRFAVFSSLTAHRDGDDKDRRDESKKDNRIEDVVSARCAGGLAQKPTMNS